MRKIRVFVGCTESERIPFLVLKHSIEERTNQPVDVIPLDKYQHRMPSTLRGPIPFSFQRFMIPEICGFKGNAIYLDSDMLCLGNIQDLWDMRGADICAPGVDCGERKIKFSVMVIDCNRVKWRIKEIAQNFESTNRALGPGSYYSELLHSQPWPGQIVCGNAPEWNDIERVDEKTKLIHYTIAPTQPWKIIRTNDATNHWYREFNSMKENKKLDPELLKDHAKRGYLNAALL